MRAVGPKPAQVRYAGRIADGHLAVCTVESHSHTRQPIDVRCLHLRIAVTSQMVVHIVSYDEDHIQRLRRLLAGCDQRLAGNNQTEKATLNPSQLRSYHHYRLKNLVAPVQNIEML